MTILGKIAEHIAPLIIMTRLGINPKDLRFLGTPVDYIAFKGLNDGNSQEIIFIEVKSGKSSSLSPRERAIKRLVEERKVRWVTLSLQEELEHIGKLIEEEVEKAARQQVQSGQT